MIPVTSCGTITSTAPTGHMSNAHAWEKKEAETKEGNDKEAIFSTKGFRNAGGKQTLSSHL